MAYYLYILESLKDSTYYVGSTQDVTARLERHNQGRSKYTKSKRPWQLIYQEEYPDRSSAVKREIEIKRKEKRSYIDQLIRTSKFFNQKLAGTISHLALVHYQLSC